MTATAATSPPRHAAASPPVTPRRRRGQALAGLLFLSPALVLFLVFVAAPVVSAIVLSFFSWDLLTEPRSAGLSNYSAMFTDGQFWTALGNTFVFTLASMITHVGGGLLLAVGVNSLKNRVLSYFVRTALFFPFVISWAAVALLWKYVLDPTFGIGSYYLDKAGIDSPAWLLDPSWALATIVGVDFWHTIGFTFVIMLAGLQTVPRELLEAARTDGASSWRLFWNVTVPLMSPTIFFASIITFIGAFQIFDPMQILNPQGGPDDSTLSIVQLLYLKGFQTFDVGYASAVSLVIFVVTMAVTAAQFLVSRRWVHQS